MPGCRLPLLALATAAVPLAAEDAAQNRTAAACCDEERAWNETLLARGRLGLATQHEGAAWPELTLAANATAAGGRSHVFAIGDWGTLLPGHLPAPNVRPTGSHNKCPEHCDYVLGVDDQAQLLVAAQMKRRAAVSNPQYVLNAGDSFYWGGIIQPCGAGTRHANGLTVSSFARVWQSVYGPLTSKPWIGTLGNHDYGGWRFDMGWDQVIAYSFTNPNWVMPARYFSRRVSHPGFSVEYFIIDSNAHDAKPPAEDPEHNICGELHNPEGATCAAVGGPTSPAHCQRWFWSSYRAQQRWLEARLAASTADWRVVLTHFPCFTDAAWYASLHRRLGLDLLVTGHRHTQELWPRASALGGLTCLVTGGGGGITSEAPPTGPRSSQYGFFDLTLSRRAIKIELVNFNGHVLRRATVRRRHVTAPPAPSPPGADAPSAPAPEAPEAP